MPSGAKSRGEALKPLKPAWRQAALAMQRGAPRAGAEAGPEGRTPRASSSPALRDETRPGFAVCAVSGHGVGAGWMMALVTSDDGISDFS